MFPKGFNTPLTDESGAPMQTMFSQQRIEAWRPLFTPVIVTVLLLFSGFAIIGLGICFYLISKNTIEVDLRYDDYCNTHYANQSTCVLPFKIQKDMKGTMFLLYRLTNFYQNHQRYVNSRSDAQLRGEYVTYDDMSYCGDYRSIDGTSNPQSWLLPCGAIAYSVFNDTFDFSVNDNTTLPKPEVQFQDVAISWRSDREKLFKNLSPEYDGVGVHWLDNMNNTFPKAQRDEHFIVWMRTAATPNFMKTYRRCIDCYLPANGDYSIVIQNNYPTSLFNGEKHVVITTVSPLGGKNDQLGLSYIVVGSLLFLSGIVILVSHLFFPRKLGDTTLLRRIEI